MSELLYIEGLRMDLAPRSMNRTLQINDIGDVKDRQSNFSTTNKLPLTPNNIKNFNFLGISGNNSLAPYRKLRCDYSLEGIPLVRNGYAVVKATNSHYEVVVYDGIIDLAERIKGKKINELNYSDLNHYLTVANYQNSFLNTEGYIYALGYFGLNVSITTLQINEQAPSVFIHTIWNKIFEEAGLNYVGSFFENNVDFNTEVISPEKGYEVEEITQTSIDLGSGQTDTISRVQSSSSIIRFQDQHTFDFETFSEMSVANGSDLQVNFSGQITINISTDYLNNNTWLNLDINVNGIGAARLPLPEGQTSKDFTVQLSVQSGDILTFWLYGADTFEEQEEIAPGQFVGSGFYVEYSASSSISITKQEGGTFIDFGLFMPELNQIDFIKDIMHRYGLLLRPVRNSNTYEFIQFEELLNDRANAQDWSEKLSSIEEETYDSDYAKENIASYNYPEEIATPTYDGSLLIDNENAGVSKPLFSSPYEIAVREATYKGEPLYSLPIWELKDNAIELKDTPPKIFRVHKITDSIDVRLFNNANVTTITGAIPFLSLRNMEMQYFLNNNYKAFRELINKPKQLKTIFNLNLIDIYNLDFFKLKYLKQTGKFYYLNNVKHTAGKVPSAELIQLNGFSINLPPTVLGLYETSLNFQSSKSITLQNITDQTNPAYFDPEFNEPAAIMITGGFNNNVLIKNGSQVLTSQIGIPVEDLNLIVEDVGNIEPSHVAEFTFKIKDTGSGQYSDVEGTIRINVNENVNSGPTANAGSDIVQEVPDDGMTTNISVNGSASTPGTGAIVSYGWIITSKPVNSTASITDSSDITPEATLVVPNTNLGAGVYTLELTVTDDNLLFDTDTVNVTVDLIIENPE